MQLIYHRNVTLTQYIRSDCGRHAGASSAPVALASAPAIVAGVQRRACRAVKTCWRAGCGGGGCAAGTGSGACWLGAPGSRTRRMVLARIGPGTVAGPNNTEKE